MKIYAIIVTYNAMYRGWIDRCMESLQSGTVPISPIIVDNCSTDGTRKHVPSKYPDAIWLPQEKNLGFGQANNVGIRYAIANNADYVLLLNQDASLSPDAIETMLKISDGKSLLSPLHLNGDGTHLDYMFRGSIRDNWELQDDLLVRKNLEPFYYTGEICAACWFMPIGLIKIIGGFNPLFFHYSEDNNFYNRMAYHGIKTILVPNVFMYHDRKVVGNTKAYNNKHLRRDLMLVSCDINQSIVGQAYNFLKILSHCYRYELLEHKYYPGMFLKELLWILFHIRKILSSRKKEKTIGSHWL